MNVGVILCLQLAGIFFILAVIFAIFKDRAAILIGGFNTIPQQDRDSYDKHKMSLDMRNSLLLWTFILLIGAALSYIFSPYFGGAAFILWIVVFFKDVHFNTLKAFAKYKIK